MRIPTAIRIDPTASDLWDQIALLPASAGIYALLSPSNQPYISWSSSLRKRLTRLVLRSSSDSAGLVSRMRNNLACIECWPTGSRLERSLIFYQLVKSHFPDDYLRRLKLRMPWFVGFTVADPFPRLAISNRISRNAALLFGPFLSRDAAQQYEQELSGLFQVRRCTDVLVPHPEHPGCIYGEMNQCLKPCQCAVSPEEYATEVRRVSEFLSTNGRSAMAALAAARERAANETNFEEAAFLHKRLEKMKSVAALRNEVVSEVRQFNGVALTSGIAQRQFRLWPIVNGYWQEPTILDFAGEESQAKSLDQELRERLSFSLANTQSNETRIEHLAIFSRWYYSSWRDGQWFPFRTLADLNYRKLVRNISNLVKVESGVPAE